MGVAAASLHDALGDLGGQRKDAVDQRHLLLPRQRAQLKFDRLTAASQALKARILQGTRADKIAACGEDKQDRQRLIVLHTHEQLDELEGFVSPLHVLNPKQHRTLPTGPLEQGGQDLTFLFAEPIDAQHCCLSGRVWRLELIEEKAEHQLDVEIDQVLGGGVAPEDISDLVSAGTSIIGYYGALAEWFDYGLLGQLAERLADHAFVMIGPDYDGTLPRSEVTDLPNVYWLGPKPYTALPAYLDRFAVATIPFVVNDVTHSVSPLKLFEYMAGGKPVITPPLRECARYPEVFLADGVDEWAEMVELAIELGADDSFRQRMIAAAEQNTWDARVQTILEAL